jgi:uncharacterized protein YmfQ (DUF2313 family)
MSDTLLFEDQPLCGLTGEDYAEVLADLLPRGFAWPRDPDSVIQRVMRGLAEEFARVTARDCDLLAEAYPCGATETLPDWERITGLPDPCTGPLPTIQQRRAAVCAKLGAAGGADEEYFKRLAAALGYEIEIETFRPFLASHNHANEPLYGPEWAFVWHVTVISTSTSVVWFSADVSHANEPLASFNDLTLRCLFEALKPAHTFIIWTFE